MNALKIIGLGILGIFILGYCNRGQDAPISRPDLADRWRSPEITSAELSDDWPLTVNVMNMLRADINSC